MTPREEDSHSPRDSISRGMVATHLQGVKTEEKQWDQFAEGRRSEWRMVSA